MSYTKHIVIIGGGFCGTMTAVNLIRDAKSPLKITIINAGAPFILGVAFKSYSSKHLLNVAANNMSAYPEDPMHFTKWVKAREEYKEFETDLLAKTFLPRNLFGEYLQHIWDTTLGTKRNDVDVEILEEYVTNLEFMQNNSVKVILQNGGSVIANYIVLATGNSLPRNPQITNQDYFSSVTYFRNPWHPASVSTLNQTGDVLIIGNGLTMVDTVMGLIEKGFKNKIHSISANGFGVLPHRHFGIQYTGLVKELQTRFELYKLVGIVNKHIKKVRKLGVSAGPVIDSLRPYSQRIWESLSLDEKKKFLSRLRHLWGVARHRLPVFIFDIIQKLRIEGQLVVHEGTIINITETDQLANVTFFNSKKKHEETLTVQRVINCTGPESSIYKTLNPLLRKLAEKKIISSDPLELGINIDVKTYNIINAEGEKINSVYTLGNNLKGQLWETVAVPELRLQAQQLSKILLEVCAETKLKVPS